MSWIQVWHIAEMHPEPKIKSYKKKPAAPVEGKFFILCDGTFDWI